MSSTQETTTKPSPIVIERLTGMVKWFNNKAGFGFITVCGSGEHANKDIFVHYTSIKVTNTQYMYLVQGEYVDFDLVASNGGAHEFYAASVCGVKGGAIMCETRRLSATTQPPTPSFQGRRYNMRPDNSGDARNNDRNRPRREEDGSGYVRRTRVDIRPGTDRRRPTQSRNDDVDLDVCARPVLTRTSSIRPSSKTDAKA